jgi:hypothetical protein
MKIDVSNNRIFVKRMWREGVSVAKSDITRLVVMGDYKRNALRLGFFDRWFRRTACLRFLLIESNEVSITLDAFQDSGFERALAWLRESDWDINSGINQALETPLIRVPVSKLRRY